MENSLFFVTLPKSGTTFTWHTIAKCSSLTIPSTAQDQASLDQIFNGSEQDLDWEVSTGSFYTERLVENDVWETRAKGMVCGSHMRATPNNLAVLKNKGIKKLTLLLRDPRDATLSWAHHINSIGDNVLNNENIRKFTPFPDDYWHWSFEDQLSYHCKTYLPLCINWIECWLNFIATEDDIDFNIVYFDQLRSDPVSYFKQIAEFHTLKNFDYSQIKKPSVGEVHFRKGENGGFFSEAKSEDVALAELLISTRLKDAFNRAVTGQFNRHHADDEFRRKFFISNFSNIPSMAQSLNIQSDVKFNNNLFEYNSSLIDLNAEKLKQSEVA